jgi:hypothetical protein
VHDSGTFPRQPNARQKSSRDHALVILIHSVYDLSQMVMNSAILPRSSRRSASPQELPDVLKRSVDAALAHARHVGILLRQYIHHDCDITRLAPFVGYAAYVASCILVTFSKVSTTHDLSRNTRLQRDDAGFVVSMINIVDSLVVFWKPLARLVSLPIF